MNFLLAWLMVGDDVRRHFWVVSTDVALFNLSLTIMMHMPTRESGLLGLVHGGATLQPVEGQSSLRFSTRRG